MTANNNEPNNQKMKKKAIPTPRSMVKRSAPIIRTTAIEQKNKPDSVQKYGHRTIEPLMIF